MGTRSKIFFSSKNRGGVGEFDFGLGLRMNQQHKDSSSSSSLPRTKTQVSCRDDIYDVVGGSVPTSHQYNLSASGVRSGFAFTVAQWQELQRQSAIFKYMVASVPVPHELLMPFTKPTTPSILGSKKGVNKETEPWRCRRTDGKKWRCTRDVAPDQKYCERHTHKGRHARSRKPVEHLHSDFIPKVKPYQKHCFVSGNNNNSQSRRETEEQLCSFPGSLVAAPDDQYRCLEWFIKGESVPVSNSNQEWMIPTGFSHGDQTQQTRVFMSERSENKSSASSNGKLPFSCLTLSVSGGDEMEEVKPNWMTSGGPLGEALCLGIATSTTTSTTSYAYGDAAQRFNN